MVDDHEDYETGAAPAAHKVSHQDGGTDKISVAGLAGEPLALAAHKILPAIHHVKFTAAEARAAINNIFGADGKADVDINLDTHKLINVVDPVADQGGDTRKARNDAISTHAGLATVHQDAPGLIETHRLAAGAHHAKYTDAEARGLLSPMSISCASFHPAYDTNDWELVQTYLVNRVTLESQVFMVGVVLPPGVTVTKLTLFGFRNDALAVMRLRLFQMSNAASQTIMATVEAGWTTGNSSGFDDSITEPVINNSDYHYCLSLVLDPNDSKWDVRFFKAQIDFTG